MWCKWPYAAQNTRRTNVDILETSISNFLPFPRTVWSVWLSSAGRAGPPPWDPTNQPQRDQSHLIFYFSLLSITTDVTPIIMSSIKTTTVTTIKTMTANSGMGLVAVLSDTERACHLIFLPNTHLSFRVFYCLFFWHAKTFITALYFPWWQSNSSFGQP